MSSPAQTAAAPSFEDVGVPGDLARALIRSKRPRPFAIQIASLPDSLAGRDICGKAPTGSGKTLAFAIPAVALAKTARPNRPTVLILTPTRELAAQIREEIKPLADVRRVSSATFYGGTNINTDIRALNNGCDIAIATPGRLEDLIQRRLLRLDEVGLVILDEADRMADMGFLPVVKRLLDQTPDRRQTLLFSATLDGDVDVLIRRYQTNPARHEVAQPAAARGDVRHHFWTADPTQRRGVAKDVLDRVDQAIVFARTKRGADRLARDLGRDGVSCVAIHGDRTQSQREKALKKFSTGQVKALIATDVAARGIHVDHVSAVLHYDIAGSDKDYVHRSGRTGRAGATGVVVTLVRPDDRAAAKTLLRDLDGNHKLTAPDLDRLTDPGELPALDEVRDDDSRSSQGQRRGDGGRGRSSGRGETRPEQGGRDRRGQGQRDQDQRGQSRRDGQGRSTETTSGRAADTADGTTDPRREQRPPAGATTRTRKRPNSSKNKGRPRRLREADRAARDAREGGQPTAPQQSR
jgi:superfamily II DNA/RNA helicase